MGTVLAANMTAPGALAFGQAETASSADTEQSADLEEKAVTDYSKYENGELLVIYKEDASKKEKKAASSGVAVEERTQVTDWCDKITLEEEGDLEAAVERVAESEDVLYVQPNFQYQAMGTVSSAEDIEGVTESDFAKQWWVYNDGTFEEPEDAEEDYFWPPYNRGFWPFSAGQTPLKSDLWDWDSLLSSTVKAVAGMDTNTAKAWQQFSTGGRKTLVAVIDTGIDYTHSELKDSMWVNSGEIPDNGIDDDGNGYIDDVYGWDFYYGSSDVYAGTSKIRGHQVNEDEHGTHVAGIIAAAKDGTGTAGIASNTDVELMSLKVLGGEDGVGDTESIVKAIAYAEAQGAEICNMSFGINETDIPFYMEDYDQAMKEAVQKSSMLFVTAAGNEGTNNDNYGVFPSSYDFDNIIAVANLRCDGTMSEYSNYGEKTVDLAAPGMYIYSTVPGNQYEYMSGSSMAAPMVTAACAMGYAYAKNPDVLAVRERILANVTKNSQLAGKVSTGGMLNVYDAVWDLAQNSYTYTGNQENTENTQNRDSGNTGSENTQNADSESTSSENRQNADSGNTNSEDTQNAGAGNTQNTGSGNTNSENTESGNAQKEIAGAAQDAEQETSAIGKQFIQNGMIYKIISDSSASVSGIVDSAAKKIVIADEVTYGSKSYQVTEIKNQAFYKNQSVTSAVIGKNVKTIGKWAFLGCKQLKKVSGMEAVKKIKAEAFRGCTKLKSMTLTDNVTKIAGSAFLGCKKLSVKVVKGSYAAKFIKKKGMKVSYL